MKRLYTGGLITLLFLVALSAQQPIDISFGDMRARSIGPAVMSGRISSIDGSASNPRLLYIGAASGGVWKSISAGASFSPVFDEHIQSIGAIHIDQQHPDTVWVGTGEPWVRNSTSVGKGIYVTTNGGREWTFKGLENSERIANIVVDPGNSSRIYVAAQGPLWSAGGERGVYLSEDFGQTWSCILNVDENTGCADLAMNPKNPDELFAAMWDHRRSPDFFRSGGPGSGLYHTTDGGKTWKQLTPQENGLPAGTLGRMAVAFAPSDPSVVYLTIEAEKKDDKGLYRSEDGGKTWKKVNSSFNTTVRPFYFSRIVVDPTNPDKVFKCGLNLTISKDGGKTFRTVGSGVHSDIHAVWINPNNSDHIVIGTDGGGYRSLDGGYEFEMFMNLPISQFYHVSVDNEEPFNVYGGLQDNGSWYGPSASPGGVENKDWKLSNWGDGFYSFPHPTDKNIIYSESQGGNLVRHDRSDGQSKDIQPIAREGEPELRFNWNAPVHISPNNPERLYFGAQYLYVTENRGDSWQRISPDLTTNDPQRQRQKQSGGLSIDNSGAENNTTIYTIAESPRDEKVIWVGTDDGNVQVTTDGGQNWTNVAPNMPDLPEGLWVSCVEPGHFDSNTCYVSVDGHRSGDMRTYVYKTTDLGKTWTSIATKETEGHAHVIREDPENPNLLFLGTEFGLYISLDGGLFWERFENNMPKVPVHALVVHPRDAALVIGTHGRGIYIIDDLLPLRQISPEVLNETLHFFKTKPAYIRLPHGGTPFGGAGNFVGANPNVGAYIAYYMRRRHTFGKMTMEIVNEKGEVIKTVTPGKSGGINVVTFPTRLRMPKGAPTKNRQALGSSVFPPAIPEGLYTVRIKKGKQTYETQVNLQFDPAADAKYPREDRQLALETQMRLFNLTERIGYIYYALQDMHTRAETLFGKVPKKLDGEVRSFAEATKKEKESLVSLEGDGYVDESSRLREDVAMLYGRISNYPGRPSDDQLRRTAALEKQFQSIQDKFDAFVQRMKALNEKLKKKELPEIKIQTWEEFVEDEESRN